MTQFISSSKNTPCPVCGREKDQDCCWAEDLETVLCHTKANPDSKVPSPADEVNGYKFTGKVNDKGYCSRSVYVLVTTEAVLSTPFTKANRPKSNQVKHFYYPTLDGQKLCRVNRLDKGEGKKQFWQEYWITDDRLAKHRSEGCWVSVSDLKVRQGKATQEERNLYLQLSEPMQSQIHLYRIGDLINQKAINSTQPLLIVEGESIVDKLLSLGIAATCSIGGAGKWRLYGGVAGNYKADLSEAIQKNIILCPDRDTAGANHALQIAADFASARWLYANPEDCAWDSPNDGYDISDWIEEMEAEGIDKHSIVNRVGQAFEKVRHDSAQQQVESETSKAQTGNVEPSYQDFLKKVASLLQYTDTDEYKFHRTKLARTFGYRVEDIDDLIRRKLTPEEQKEERILDLEPLRDRPEFALAWLVPGILPKGESLLLSAEAKMGKTLLSDDLIFHIVTGEDDFLGARANPQYGRVLKVSVDESVHSTVLKAEKRFGPAWLEKNRVRLIIDWKITEIEFLQEQIDSFKPDLVVIDSLRQVASGVGISENSAEFVDAIATVIKMCRRKNVSLVVIHHDNKNKESQGIDRARGSSSLPAAFWGIARLDPFFTEVEEGDGKQKRKIKKIDPQDTRRFFNLTARDVAPQHLLIDLELENHHWLNLGDCDDTSGIAKEFEDRIINLLKINTVPLCAADLFMMMELEFSQKRSLYRAIDKLVAKRLINKVKGNPTKAKGRPTWCYTVEQFGSRNSEVGINEDERSSTDGNEDVSATTNYADRITNSTPPSLSPSEVELSQNTPDTPKQSETVSDVDTEPSVFNDSQAFCDKKVSSGLREGGVGEVKNENKDLWDDSVDYIPLTDERV